MTSELSLKRRRGRLAHIEHVCNTYPGGEWPYGGGDGIHAIMLATMLGRMRAIRETITGQPSEVPDISRRKPFKPTYLREIEWTLICGINDEINEIAKKLH